MTEADKKALGTDYAEGEVSRSEAERYPLVQRGSVRLTRNLYRTESEQREFIDEGLRLRLAGTKRSSRPPQTLVLDLIRRLLGSLKITLLWITRVSRRRFGN